MDYTRNEDKLGRNCLQATRISGIQYSFTDESSYVEPVSLQEFKDYASIDGDTYDGEIQLILTGARKAVEQYLQKSLGIRTVRLQALEIPNETRVSWGPVADGTANFFGDVLKVGGNYIDIDFVTDGRLGSNEDIKLAILKQAYNAYENKDKYLNGGQEIGTVLDEVKSLLNPHRNVYWP